MTDDTPQPTPTALVSWAHDSDAGAELPAGPARVAADAEWQQAVLDLVTHLRVVGDVDADVDVVHDTEPVDWSRWGPGKVRSSDFVIVAVNKAWARRFDGEEAPDRGAGATAEADELLGMYERERESFDRKLIIALLPGVDKAVIPTRLLGRVTRVQVKSFDRDGLDQLLRRIYGKPKHTLAPLRGKAPALPVVPPSVDPSGDATEGGGQVREGRRATGRSVPSRADDSLDNLLNRRAVIESALRALPVEAANEGTALPLGRQWNSFMAEYAEVEREIDRRRDEADSSYVTVRLMWVNAQGELGGYQADVRRSFIEQGWIRPNGAGFPGPQGLYRLMPEEHWRTVDFEDAAPIFLQDAYRSRLEKWIEPFASKGEEVQATIAARDSVVALVDSRLAADEAALTVSSTVTSSERTSQGLAVVGRAVLISPT